MKSGWGRELLSKQKLMTWFRYIISCCCFCFIFDSLLWSVIYVCVGDYICWFSLLPNFFVFISV